MSKNTKNNVLHTSRLNGLLYYRKPKASLADSDIMSVL